MIVSPFSRRTPRRPIAALAAALAGTAASAAPVTVAPMAALVAALVAALAIVSPWASRDARAADDGLDLSTWAGKVVYVDFWASWCTPCRASFPWMNALQEELGEEGLVVVGVNTGDDPAAAARFLDEVPAEFEIVADDDGSIAKAYAVEGMPTAYVHDRHGALVASHVGFDERSAEERAAELRALVRGTR